MKIVIVGAGLGGTTAAFCLGRSGHNIYVLERRPTLQPLGGALNVRPNASRHMHAWGLADDLNEIGEDVTSTLLRDMETGDLLRTSCYEDASEYPDVSTWRDRLLQVLYRRTTELRNVEFSFGVTVIGVEDDHLGASIACDDGTTIRADLIIAADGAKSRIRKQVLEDCSEPKELIMTGVTLHGFELKMNNELLHDPALVRLFQPGACAWMGREIYTVSRYDQKLRLLFLAFGVRMDPDQTSDWHDEESVNRLKLLWKDSCVELSTILQRVHSCSRWALGQMPKIPRWTSAAGRVLLLGDSAHALVTSGAQGYSQIVEDVAVLDHLIMATPNAINHLPRISRDWQDVRKPRVERVAEMALSNNRLYTGNQGETRSNLNTAQAQSLKDVRPDKDKPFASLEFMKWLLDYDAVQEAAGHLKQNDRRKDQGFKD